MQFHSKAQLGIESSKKQSLPQIASDIFLVSRESAVLFRGKSQDLSVLTRQTKLKQMDILYDHYNLFKYSKVVTGDNAGRSRNIILAQTKNEINPQIKKYKNGYQARKQSTELKNRLGQLKDGRKNVMNQIKKIIHTDKK